jgi:hypothetical protein
VLSHLLLLVALPCADPPAPSPDRLADAAALAARVDALTEKHWQKHHLQTAAAAGDTEFLRRITLDLAGRIPTHREATAFVADSSADKRARTIRRLMESPEYALHLGRVLDDMIQDRYAGDPEFVEYLRSAVAEHKPWDQVFREVLLGPWDTKEYKRADRFLVRRLNSLDDMTNDTARVFFGVNVSCARCHDHPLAPDWTQDHYYGMASFFNRTGVPLLKGLVSVSEKSSGEVMFVTKQGKQRTAKMRYLSGQVIEEPAPMEPPPGKKAVPFSRREQLVKVALEEKHFFSRAIVNRLWAYFLGRGLVQPVDQMHSANPPSIPAVLDALAEDLVEHRYDLDRIVAAIVSSRAYQLSSTWTGPGDAPAEKHFARARVRPLSPQQYALSLLLATGDGTFDQTAEGEPRAKRYRELEGQSAALLRSQALDARSDRFQSSTTEALFMSNHADVQRLTAPSGNNLTARLAALADNGQAVDLAIWTVLSRAPEADERAYLVKWLDEHKQDRAKACGEMVWALMTSAEFRFNH